MPIMRDLIWVLFLCHFCFAQQVKVRVISSQDGHALPKQAVSVQFFYEKPAKVTPPLHIETDRNGEAQFSIPEPTPEHLDVRVALTSEHWHCACWVMADTGEVIQKGITQTAPTNKAKAPNSADPEPRQIVFIARPFTFFEKLLYPLVKQ